MRNVERMNQDPYFPLGYACMITIVNFNRGKVGFSLRLLTLPIRLYESGYLYRVAGDGFRAGVKFEFGNKAATQILILAPQLSTLLFLTQKEKPNSRIAKP